jgi:hypothetical protein
MRISVFSEARIALIMIFADFKAGDLTYLSSWGKNIENILGKIKNSNLRESINKMTMWDFKNRFSIEECVYIIEK